MFLFSCNHPAKSLFVKRDSTMGKRDSDFTDITHHLFCMKCGSDIDISYSMMNHTVQEFLYSSEAKSLREQKEIDK